MNPNWNTQNTLPVLTAAVVGALVVTALYWARLILIPFALAVYLTFLLSVPVGQLQRLGMRRTPAVLLVALLAGAAAVGFGLVAARQVGDVVAELPRYRGTIQEKARGLREMTRSGALAQLERGLQDFLDEVAPPPPAPPSVKEPGPEAPAKAPVQVVVQAPSTESWAGWARFLLLALAEPAAQALLTAVMVLFMLLKREDLRNRLIRLLGPDRLAVTTRAIDEADRRIARFLLAQFLLNLGFGLAAALGLALLGIDGALLWGLLAGVLRYVPYIGAWVGAAFPLALSVVAFPGWLQPLLVLGLFITLEVVAGNLVEPVLFGHSIGVSEVALLVSAGFWAFLWGPVGLVLSGPLTVCLLVAGRHVPQLWFLDVLLGDATPLSAATSFYQRLLARDQDEAAEIVQTYLAAHPAEEVYDDLFVPALAITKRDRDRDDLAPEREEFILQATREIIESVVAGAAQPAAAGLLPRRSRPEPAPAEPEPPAAVPAAGTARVRVLACPARDQEDHLALEMLQRLLDPTKWDVEVLAVEALAVELLDRVSRTRPALVCVGAVAPGGLTHSRYLCKRLRGRFEGLKILVGRWGDEGAADEVRRQLLATGADEVATSLRETCRQLHTWLPVLAQSQPDPAVPAAPEPVRA